MKGLKEGESGTIDFDYPKDYFNKDLAGKKAHFDVTIQSVRKKNMPELNDDFAKDLGNFKTFDEVKADIEKRIVEAKEGQQKNVLFGQIIQELVQKTKFELPETLVNSELTHMLEVTARDMEQKGQNIRDLDPKELIAKMRPEAENRVRGFLVLDKLAQEEKIEVTEKEVEEHLGQIAQANHRPLQEIKAHYEKQELMGSLRFRILNEKTLEFVLNEAKIKVVKPEKKKKIVKIGRFL